MQFFVLIQRTLALFFLCLFANAVSANVLFLSSVTPIDAPKSVVVSPDGNHVYMMQLFTGSVHLFSRDNNGDLVKDETPQGVVSVVNAKSIALSPDGANVYVACDLCANGAAALVIFERNAGNGQLTLLQSIVIDVLQTTSNIRIAVSPDSDHIYAITQVDHSVIIFDKQSQSIIQRISDAEVGGEINGLSQPTDVAVDPTGSYVYIVSNGDSALTTFTRDSVSGILSDVQLIIDNSQGGSADGLDGESSIAVSQDGRFIYVASIGDDAVSIFENNSGTLNHIGTYREGDGSPPVTGIADPTDIVLSPDGSLVFVSSVADFAIAQFYRNPITGELQFFDYIVDDTNGYDGIGDLSDIALSPDGSNLYTAAIADASESTTGKIGVFNIPTTDLELKSMVQLDPAPGDRDFVYRSRIRNRGAVNANNVTFYSQLPVGFSVSSVRMSTGEVLSCPLSADNELTCSFSFLPANSSLSVEVLLNVPQNNTYTISSVVFGQFNDVNASNNTTTTTFAVQSGITNQAPIAVDDQFQTLPDQALTILLNDTINNTGLLDNDSDPDIESVTVVESETDSFSAHNGIIVIDGQQQNLTYTPANGFAGIDTFEYVISDGNGGKDWATVTVTVNTPPVATNLTNLQTDRNAATDIDLLASGSDVDGHSLAVVLNQEGLDLIAGNELSDNGNGQYTYNPPTDFIGYVSFQYKLVDELSAESAWALAEILVDTAPIAVDDPDTSVSSQNLLFATTVDQALIIHVADILSNDYDPDYNYGDTTLELYPESLTSNSVVLNGNTITYTPPAAYTGSDQFQYQIQDNFGLPSTPATVNLVVHNTPVAQNDIFLISPTSSNVNLDVLANDSDAEQHIIQIAGFDDASVSGSLTINGVQNFVYSPNGFIGITQFTYRVMDELGAVSEPATVMLTVNTAPALTESELEFEMLPGTTQTVDLLTNAADTEGHQLSVNIIDQSNLPVELVDNGDGNFSFTPPTDFGGTAAFTYTIVDELNTPSQIGTVNFVVSTAPLAQDDIISMLPNSDPVTIFVLFNDSDADGHPISVYSYNFYNDDSASRQGTLVKNMDDSFTFTVQRNFVGLQQFTYNVIEDFNGQPGLISNDATVTIIINSPTLVQNDSVTTRPGQPITIDVLDNDSDPDGQALSVSRVTASVEGGTVEINSDQTVTYTPPEEFQGVDSFSYFISDSLEEFEGRVEILVQSESLRKPPSDRNSLPAVDNSGGGGAFDILLLFIMVILLKASGRQVTISLKLKVYE